MAQKNNLNFTRLKKPFRENRTAYLSKITDFYQKKQVKFYTSLILTLSAIAFFTFLAIRPTLTVISSLRKEISDQEKVVTKLEEKLKNLGRAQQEYQEVKSELYLLNEALPKTPQLSLFLGQLEVLARENNLAISAIQTSEVPLDGNKILSKNGKGGKSSWPSFTVKFSLSGGYQEIEKFLTSVTILRRMTHIKSVFINSKKSSGESTLNFRPEIEVFYLPEEVSI